MTKSQEYVVKHEVKLNLRVNIITHIAVFLTLTPEDKAPTKIASADDT